MGDLNVQVGADGLERVIRKHGLGSRNENLDMPVDFCNENRLVICGTVLKHKTCNKVTWVQSDRHTENQIDHILIHQRWRKSMCDVRNIRNADVGSDHHLVVMSLKLKTATVLRQSQNAPKQLSEKEATTIIHGTLLISIEDQLRRWKDHFCALLNEDPVEQSAEVPQLNEMPRSFRGIDIKPPSVAEIETAINLLKNNKVAGLDGVPAEFLKADPATAASILHPLIQTVWENETYPREWKDGVIVKVSKKDDLINFNNWRGITVLSVFPKLMATLILNRIKTRIETTLKRNQASFRKGRRAWTIRIVFEQCTEFQTPLNLMFIDFEKAFDRVNRECIWRSLLGRGIPPKIVAIIKESYNNERLSLMNFNACERWNVVLGCDTNSHHTQWGSTDINNRGLFTNISKDPLDPDLDLTVRHCYIVEEYYLVHRDDKADNTSYKSDK
ncbi:uncharacterized protein LOC129942628 [Eupeodes corollae]|uniref:uncharacterized protein LOC129942628 n=1 Tax=Eupeodes corollae TaxID=290404 RepID=UPI0024913E72|nr:uncharacterized protein LOC129942628 [Eupeodes corollae]